MKIHTAVCTAGSGCWSQGLGPRWCRARSVFMIAVPVCLGPFFVGSVVRAWAGVVMAVASLPLGRRPGLWVIAFLFKLPWVTRGCRYLACGFGLRAHSGAQRVASDSVCPPCWRHPEFARRRLFDAIVFGALLFLRGSSVQKKLAMVRLFCFSHPLSFALGWPRCGRCGVLCVGAKQALRGRAWSQLC